METILSNLVQKMYSDEYENIATESLCFIIENHPLVKNGFLDLLKQIGISSERLLFKSQFNEENIRPDMCGYDDLGTRVYIENKFWAGFTDNQPNNYIKKLCIEKYNTALVIVVPAAREQMAIREMLCRLEKSTYQFVVQENTPGFIHQIKISNGPMLAITTWAKVLFILEQYAVEDKTALNDIYQLRSLCEAADHYAFIPFSSEKITDQRIPSFIVQLSQIVQTTVQLAISKGVLYKGQLKPQANWERIGQYAKFSNELGVGVWFGVNFQLWKRHGITPLWVVIDASDPEFSRINEVGPLIEKWGPKAGYYIVNDKKELSIAIDVNFNNGRDVIVTQIVDVLSKIEIALSAMIGSNK